MRSARILCAVAAVLVAATPAAFPGDALAAASGGTVSVQTVPSVAGIGIAVGSVVVTTDSGGYASAYVPDLNHIALLDGSDRRLRPRHRRRRLDSNEGRTDGKNSSNRQMDDFHSASPCYFMTQGDPAGLNSL